MPGNLVTSDMDGGDCEVTNGEENGLLGNTQVVFQCEACRSILGDSTSWITASEQLESFTLSMVTDNIVAGKTLQHSTQTHDAGSSYTLLFCKVCRKELGRQYITTPSHLDQIRDNFTLYVGMVTSYEIGSANVKAMSESKSQEMPTLLMVAERCKKVQHLVVLMNERLCKIEQFLHEDTDMQ